LFIISIWLLLSVRRENYVIVSLLGDTQGPTDYPDIGLLRRQWQVYQGIVTNSVFTTYITYIPRMELGDFF
jgi:hypothetical protein